MLTRSHWILALVIITLGAAAVLLFLSGRSPTVDVKNVLLISIDTCRADHLGCYGHPGPITPSIDAIADEAVVFSSAVSPVPITLPAHCSLLTGNIPPHHGVRDNLYSRLAPANLTLAEILDENGFTTAAIVGAFVLDSRFGLDQGFGTYDDRFEEEHQTVEINERSADETGRRAIEWMRDHGDRPFFLFVHYYDPHSDYRPPEPFLSRFPEDPYAGEIAFVDHSIGQVVAAMKELGLYDTTLVIITSDHGQMLGEHGELTHGYFVYESAIKVPLIFKLPGRNPSVRVDDPVGLIDVVPTVCSLLGVEPPSDVSGIDLSSFLLEEKSTTTGRHLYSESLTPTKYAANPLLSLVNERWKYIHTTRPELYDLTNDTGESDNLAETDPARGDAMKDLLRQLWEEQRRDLSGSELDMDEEARRRLASLGYLGGIVVDSAAFDLDRNRADPKDLIDLHLSDSRVAHLIAAGRFEEAASLNRTLLEQCPEYVIGHLQMGRISMELGDHRGAVSSFQEALRLEPGNAKAHYSLGLALSALGRLDEALQQYELVPESAPDHSDAQNNLGLLAAGRGSHDEAVKHYEQALRVEPDLVLAHNNLANALVNLGRPDEALEHYRQALVVEPDSAAVHGNLASVLAAEGRVDEAIAEYGTALSLLSASAGESSGALGGASGAADLHNKLGKLLGSQGRTDDAIEHFRQAVSIDAGLAEAHNNLGNALRTQGRLDEAIRCYGRAIEAMPGSAGLHYNLGATLLMARRPGEAVEHLDRAVRLEADFAPALSTLAWILATSPDATMRKPREAVRLARRASELTNHRDPDILDILAAAYAAAGDFENAVATAQLALERASASPGDPSAERFRQRLELYKQGKSFRVRH